MLKFPRIFKLSATRGSTLIESMAAVAVLGIIIYTASQLWSFLIAERQFIELRSHQERLAAILDSKLKNPREIYLSIAIPDNAAFTACLLGPKTDACTSRSQGSAFVDYGPPLVAFSLASPDSFRGAGATMTPQYSTMTPQYYNRFGVVCSNKNAATDRLCLFKAEAFYFPLCPRGPTGIPLATCTQARGFTFVYRVTQVQHLYIGATPSPRFLAPIPANGTAKPFTLTTSQILDSYRHNHCNLGSLLEGFTNTGEPLCSSCRFPYTKSIWGKDRYGKPICIASSHKSQTCKDNEIYRGLADNGSTICLPYAQAFDCLTFRNTLANNCPDGYWLNQAQIGRCTFNCSIPDGGGACDTTGASPSGAAASGLNCPNIFYACCRYKGSP